MSELLDALVQAADTIDSRLGPISGNSADHCAVLLRSAALEIVRLRKGLEFYANPEVYKARPHGPAFDDRDLSFSAKATLENAR